MVEAVRAGESQRSVARRFGVSLLTVQRWIERAKDQPLHEVDWSDRPSRPHLSPQRTSPGIEDLVIDTRKRLRCESVLGECGAEAIHHELTQTHPELALPSIRTIGRILERRGVLDGKGRIRRPPPPPGWYLPLVARKEAEVDLFDIVESLKIKDGPLVNVLNGISLLGALTSAFIAEVMSSAQVRILLKRHWEEVGLPHYAQFDNDTVFQGPHQHPDVFGTVTRMCLSLGVSVVFTPPREVGFQAAIENFNGLWQAKVWSRFHHSSLEELRERSERYIAAHRSRTAKRRKSAPQRRPFPPQWRLDLGAQPRGTVIYLRRATDTGEVSLLGHTFPVDPRWPHRLVRCEVDLIQSCIRFYRLRRRAPQEQPLIKVIPYHLPE